jgi:hypothetical protein
LSPARHSLIGVHPGNEFIQHIESPISACIPIRRHSV